MIEGLRASGVWELILVLISVALGFLMPIIKDLIVRICRKKKTIMLLRQEIALVAVGSYSIYEDVDKIIDPTIPQYSQYPTNKIVYPLLDSIMQNPPSYLKYEELQVLFFVYEASVTLGKNVQLFLNKVVDPLIAGEMSRMDSGNIKSIVKGRGESLLESIDKYFTSANWAMKKLKYAFSKKSPFCDGPQNLNDGQRTALIKRMKGYIEKW